MCVLYNQRNATYTMFFIIISALHVLGAFSAHHQDLIKLYVQPWVFSCFPAGVVGLELSSNHTSGRLQESMGYRTCDLPACSAVPQPTALLLMLQ
jgi:hypothetical protein